MNSIFKFGLSLLMAAFSLTANGADAQLVAFESPLNHRDLELPDRESPVANRVPDWARDAVFYQIFPERFRNGDPGNDPVHASLEFPENVPKSWKVTPWTEDWYHRAEWERQLGDDFYENGVFDRRYGGDLQGVINQLDYLVGLGVNTIYFNPVFYARSLHKYDGNSFHHVDPYFGPDPAGDLELIASETADPETWHWTAADKLFLDLIEKAHARQIRIIIDGVFNHAGRDFWAFSDIVKNQKKSPYLEWFEVKEFDDPTTPTDEFKYACWWGVETLPEFAENEDGTDLHAKPKAYIFQSTRRWMDPNGDNDPSDGIDGWRLDVANEVPDQFWRDWHAEVRKLNPKAFTIAEVWDESSDYLSSCGFSSTMNYHGFSYPVKGFLIDGSLSASEFAGQLTDRMASHPQDVRFVLQNLIDSHDTDRLASMIVNASRRRPYQNTERFDFDSGDRVSPRRDPGYDITRPTARDRQIQRLVILFQMTFVGPPMIYYGTEAGMYGADDPDDRMPMVWPDFEYKEKLMGPFGKLALPEPAGTHPVTFDRSLHDYYQALIGVRRESEPLRRGSWRVLATDDPHQLIAFERSFEDESVVVAINRSDEEAEIGFEIEVGNVLVPVMGSRDAKRVKSLPPSVVKGECKLRLPPRSGFIWRVTQDNQ